MRLVLLLGLFLVPLLAKSAASQEPQQGRLPFGEPARRASIRDVEPSPQMIPAHVDGRPIVFGSYERGPALNRSSPPDVSLDQTPYGSRLHPQTTTEKPATMHNSADVVALGRGATPQPTPSAGRPVFLQTGDYFSRHRQSEGQRHNRPEQRASFFRRLLN